MPIADTGFLAPLLTAHGHLRAVPDADAPSLPAALQLRLAGIGDKAQLQCPTRAARLQSWIPRVAGTTTGMPRADIPAVLFGHRVAARPVVCGMPARAGVPFLVRGGLARSG